MKNKKIIGIVISAMILSSIFIIGCSKKETYIITSENSLVVGKDLPEGTYNVKRLETTNNENTSGEVTGSLEDKDGKVVAVHRDLTNFLESEIVLEKGNMVSSDIKLELTLK